MTTLPSYRTGFLWLAGGAAVIAAGALTVWLPRGRSPAASPAATRPRSAPVPRQQPAAGPIRVLLRGSGRPAISVRLAGGGTLFDPATGKLLARVGDSPLQLAADYPGQRVEASAGGRRWLRPAIRLQPAAGFTRMGNRRYPGAMLARLGGSGVLVINEVPLEAYLEGVLPGELPASFALEAQKALAVAARTYVLRNRDKHASAGADVCDGVHCQVYLGQTRASARGLAAVRATRGLCAWHQGALVATFYSADCGGESTWGAQVPLPDMPQPPPEYLRPVRDCPPGGADYCRASPFHRWRARAAVADLEARLNEQPDRRIGRLQRVRFVDFDESGRVTRVELDGVDAGDPPTPTRVEMTGWEFRRLVGPLRLRSTLMRIEWENPTEISFSGAGNGHGLGLCQIGADGMAKPPYNRRFRDILTHYYPGTVVAPLQAN